MKEKRTQFDESISRILSSGEEEVPSRVWEGIESRLDSAAASKKKGVAAWWWKAAAGALTVAAACAAAFVVFDLSPVEAPSEGETMLAESTLAGSSSLAEPSLSGGESTAEMDPLAEPLFDVVPSENRSQLLAYAIPSASEAAAPSEESDAFIPESACEVIAEKTVAENYKTSETSPAKATESAPEGSVAEKEVSLVDNSDIEAVYGKEKSSLESSSRSLPLELTLGANSGIGPQKSASIPRLYAQGKKTSIGTTLTESSNSDSYNLPLSFGVGVKFRILSWLSVGTGVNYTLLSKKVNASYCETDEYGNTIRNFSTQMKNSQHYIGVPLDVYFKIFGNNKWEVYGLVGGTVEKCFMNHYSGLYEDFTVSHNKKVNGVQTSVRTGLGVEFSPVDFLGIYIDPTVRYYFNNSQPRSIRTAQPLSFGVEAGLRFKI